jgi:C4-dicarboxylate transporter DctM subunit
MITITIAAFVILLILAVPVAFAVGMAGFLGLWWSGEYPLAIIIQQIFLTADSFVLLAIPLFVLAGALMETGGIAVRLVRFAQALVGWIRGGLAMAVVVAEYIFSGISGSTIADVSAIGATMIPPLTKAGYKPEEAVSVVASASAMGILVPPCILMIIIGAIADVSVAALFAGGFIPALVMAIIMVYIYLKARRGGMLPSQTLSLRELGRTFIDALIPLGMPIIIFGGILGGVFTPTEAAAIAVFYAAIVGLFIYREISWSALPGILINSAVMTATVCFLLGTAAVVAWIMAVGQVPVLLAEMLRSLSAGPVAFLLFTALLFIILGAVIEGPAAVVILLPTFLPVVKQFGIDLIHYSIVITAAVGIGLFLPPIGVGLFISCGIAKISMDRVIGPMLPYVIFLCLGLLIVVFFPWFTLIIPRILKL